MVPAADSESLWEAMASLAPELGGIFAWLDGRNASITLTAGPRALAVRVLLELRAGGELGGCCSMAASWNSTGLKPAAERKNSAASTGMPLTHQVKTHRCSAEHRQE